MVFMDMDVVMLSKVLGYMSIAFWLCAQLPQVLKNAKLRSCEGLALPFLVNWLGGDVTNLIGCILTDQLPFQTYLAAYFCVVDFSLLSQYFCYRQPKPTTTSPLTYTYASIPSAGGSLHQSLILPPPSTAHSPRTRSSSHPAGSTIPPLSASTISTTTTVKPRSSHLRTHGNGLRTPHGSSSTLLESPVIGAYTDGSYVAIYEAALDVARAAERVERGVIRRSESQRRRLSRQTTHSQSEHEDGDGFGGNMIDSFHSDMSRQSSSTTDGIDQRMTASVPALRDVGPRGRSMTRNLTGIPTPPREEGEDQPMPLSGHIEENRHRRDTSRSVSMVRGSGGRGGRRAAGVAFMSLGLLAGGRMMGGAPSSSTQRSPIASSSSAVVSSGKVISLHQDTSPRIAFPAMYPSLFASHSNLHTTTTLFLDHSPHTPPPPPPPPPPFDIERFVGRVSAWSCTTLYLTSRLPQIWKNFQRKSVEGLSILLFLFAFCGNLTYVISILLNPAGNADPSEAGHYLLESLPYLLGSGGTLVFDLTIMLQSWIYGSAPPVSSTPHLKRLRLPGRPSYHRQRTRTAEEGHASLERQPLLTGMSQPTPAMYVHSRERSLSPGVILRLTPASVPNNTNANTKRKEQSEAIGAGGGGNGSQQRGTGHG